MKTQNKNLNAFIESLKNHNKRIQDKKVNEYHNKRYYNSMASLGLIVFFNDEVKQ